MDSFQLKKKSLRLTPLEHQLARTLRQLDVAGQPLLVAVSGGVDSVALLSALARLRPLLKNEIAVVHIHHGRTGNPSQSRFRDRASRHVQKLAIKLGVPYFVEEYKGKAALKSEADLRTFRQKALAQTQQTWHHGALIVTAHHRDDLLETHLLRLLRGTGIRGVSGMTPLSPLHANKKIRLLKPLLEIGRAQLLHYAKALKLKWVEDPSNENIEPQRNWLRQVWLPMLAKKWPGAEGSLLRSLQLIISEVRPTMKRRAQLVSHVFSDQTETQSQQSPVRSGARSAVHSAVYSSPGLSRQKFLALSRDEKTSVLAEYLLHIGCDDFSRGQLTEIVRQLDNRRGEFTFVAARNFWRVSKTLITASERLS